MEPYVGDSAPPAVFFDRAAKSVDEHIELGELRSAVDAYANLVRRLLDEEAS